MSEVINIVKDVTGVVEIVRESEVSQVILDVTEVVEVVAGPSEVIQSIEEVSEVVEVVERGLQGPPGVQGPEGETVVVGGLTQLADDPTPALSGDLILNGYSIKGVLDSPDLIIDGGLL